MAGIQLSVEGFTVPVATLRDTRPGYCVVGAQTAAAIRRKDKTSFHAEPQSAVPPSAR